MALFEHVRMPYALSRSQKGLFQTGWIDYVRRAMEYGTGTIQVLSG